MSFTRLRFSIVVVSRFSAVSLFFLYLATPATVSMIPRRSIGLPLKISSIRPWEIMEKDSRPKPESMNKSVMSFKRTFWSLIKYSLSPLRYILRVMVSSVNSLAK